MIRAVSKPVLLVAMEFVDLQVWAYFHAHEPSVAAARRPLDSGPQATHICAVSPKAKVH